MKTTFVSVAVFIISFVSYLIGLNIGESTNKPKQQDPYYNYVVYYKDGTKLPVFDAKADGVCGNAIILIKKGHNWQRISHHCDYDSILAIQ